MPLFLTNTLTRKKEEFVPLDSQNVRVYVCGLTVYDFAHIGNARTFTAFDLLVRVLKRLYPKVTYVRNITDVDDKIMDRAKANGEAIEQLTERTIAQFHKDMDGLNLLRPDIEPRATNHIENILSMIQVLIQKGHAYEAQGHVLFHVPSMPEYGKLSRHTQDELIAGARVDVAPYKRYPADFTLWKPSASDQPGWNSPWGRGRPGWHIECSAMTEAHLGHTFDIHGGGQDLIFPHHENELAQSRCTHGTALMAKVWMHTGFLMANGEKMSKSLGNFYTIAELLKEFPGEALRLALLNAHYRQPLDFTKDIAQQAKATLDRWYGVLRLVKDVKPGPISSEALAALEDDLNTPLALSHLHALVHTFHKTTDAQAQQHIAGELKTTANLMGFLQQNPEDWFRWAPSSSSSLSDTEIEEMINKRQTARKNKNFAEADRLRKALSEAGIILEDSTFNTTWRRS